MGQGRRCKGGCGECGVKWCERGRGCTGSGWGQSRAWCTCDDFMVDDDE